MIDFSKEITQTAYYTGKEAEFAVNYVVDEENSFIECDNIVFGYANKGTKKLIFANDAVIDLQYGVVVMGSEKLSARTEVKDVSVEKPLVCFKLEISKKKVWSVLDKINDSYSIPNLIEEEQKMTPTEIYTGQGGEMVLASLSSIQNLFTKNVLYKEYWLNLKIEELILCCLQTDMRNLLINSYNNKQLHDHPLANVVDYVKNNIYSSINIKTLADKAFMSKATFFRQFKHHFGITPNNYIHYEKIKEAERLLDNTKKSISEIGYQLGYSSPSYFASNFERHSGCSPKKYRCKETQVFK